ncbi:MAG: hypothetical protein AVDCRST_MAG41-1953 [uncultured Corynebacteriales bacterium]|uniref:Two-component transcriptional response regulator, LuxR family n=1 Tax=uncultured Mycobacteriales bacterium TaxID=581187 RepID=A0A6J4IKC3_9ACTN|nr:MAG: hypothetical protein AVDCRST_MAG41-1953 [uncultured Corynebacteriales bacterium]
MLEILLCIGNDLVRTGLRTVLESEAEWRVVATSPETPEDLSGLLQRIGPDLVVSDFSPAVLAAAGTGSGPVVPVILIGHAPGAEQVREALRAGARGVVANDNDSSQHVIEAVRAVAGGYAYLAPSVTAKLLDGLASVAPAVPREYRERLQSLTDREREVLRLIARGRSTAEVADELHLSRATVKSHVSHALPKLGVQDRAQAVAFAHRAGLVTVY